MQNQHHQSHSDSLLIQKGEHHGVPPVPLASHQPWWHALWVGYPMALVLTGSVFFLVLLQRMLNIGNYFVGAPLVFVVLLVGWIWGLGPACLALLSGVLMIDYWLLPPHNTFKLILWPNMLTLLVLLVLQVITLFLVAIHKQNQRQLFHAEEEARKRAYELAQSNLRLEEADQLKDHFLSCASHELKTPLTTLQGEAQLALRRLSRQAALPAECAYLSTHVEKMEGQIRRLRLLVDDLLSLSSLRTGKIPLRVAPCDLSRLCRELTGDLGTLAERPIDLRLPSESIILFADEGRLSQVISNLVANALKYSPPTTVVRVEAHQIPTHVILSIHNEGAAIPPGQHKALFEPFYRSPEASETALPGWGLGLAISQEIVHQHGGKVWLESSEEQGTTFFVELPRSDRSQEEPTMEPH